MRTQNRRNEPDPQQRRLEDAIRAARAEVVARGFIVRYCLGCLRAAIRAEEFGHPVDWPELAESLIPILNQESQPDPNLLPFMPGRSGGDEQ